jgi:hypothetical protein
MFGISLSNIFLFKKMRLGGFKFYFRELQHMRNNHAKHAFCSILLIYFHKLGGSILNNFNKYEYDFPFLKEELLQIILCWTSVTYNSVTISTVTRCNKSIPIPDSQIISFFSFHEVATTSCKNSHPLLTSFYFEL